jgi:hypothetical protein
MGGAEKGRKEAGHQKLVGFLWGFGLKIRYVHP